MLKRLRVQMAEGRRRLRPAVAAYAFARGMVDMELHSLYPVRAAPADAYAAGLARPRGPGRCPHPALSQSARISARCWSGRGAGPRTPLTRALLKRYGDAHDA